EYADAGGLLKKTAIVLSKRIGGTSGPIWGTAFLRAGGVLSGVADPAASAGAVIDRSRARRGAARGGCRREDLGQLCPSTT
ncbi:MAG: DAK2 domain-containing protein, partial [Solirubrobacteraceae bacterium]